MKRRRTRPPSYWDRTLVRWVQDDMQQAVRRLRSAQCHAAADYVARALKSVDGARRHIEGRLNRKVPQ